MIDNIIPIEMDDDISEEEDEKDWKQLAIIEFFAGYSEEDAIYDLI